MNTATETKKTATVEDIKECAKVARTTDSLEWMLYKYDNIYGDDITTMTVRLKNGTYKNVMDYVL